MPAITPGSASTSLFPAKPAAADQPGIWFSDGAVSWPDVFKVMQDGWKNEETRFSNLNTRALGVVTASSIITTVLGFFSKDLFASSSKPLTGTLRMCAGIGTGIALIGLVATAFIVVFGVLKPGGRSVFGNNTLTGLGLSGALQQGIDMTADEVMKTASHEYAGMYVGLAERNRYKAYWLTWGYLVFITSVTVSAIVTGTVIAFS